MTRLNITLSARPHLLVIWRACLVFAALVLAFATSIALRPGSALWWVASCSVAATFLGGYLFYLPARLRGLSLTLEAKSLAMRSGVFSLAARTVPLGSVQYVRLKSSPLHKRLGLCTLEIVCAGGRVEMPGLAKDEAKGLIAPIFAGRGISPSSV